MHSMTEWLEKTASRIPTHIAVSDADTSVTWDTLENKAKQGGTFLSRYVGHKDPVAIVVEKSCTALELLYSVLYSGGFYVFIDPEQPAERMEKILRRLQAPVVITEKQVEEKVRSCAGESKVFLPEEVLDHPAEKARLQEIRQGASLEDPLYTVFTSGSTGEPKGVVVSHQAASQFIRHFAQQFGITEDDIIGNQAPFDFDVSVKDIFTSLYTGAQMVVIPRTLFAVPGQLVDFLVDHEITVLVWAVTAMCMISAFGGFEYKIPEKLRLAMFSGEVMPVRQLKVWQQALPGVKFVNLYGPSEITCNCTFYEVPSHLEDDAPLPIGSPFPGRKVFLLDEAGQEVHGEGQQGQIAVSGESLADGYYHDPQRTAESFILRDGERVYLTGDIGYYGQDGLLHFTGRQDNQIKHMGHRIELGEVENAMEKVEGVRRACCLYDQRKNRVIGFYLGDLDKKELRKGLKELIPNYMIPNKFICKESFPVTQHGKTDRKKLREEAGITDG